MWRAAGLADGLISKLGALHRTALSSTLELWADTLGFQVKLEPTEFSPDTKSAIAKKQRHRTQTGRSRAGTHDPIARYGGWTPSLA
jgi:hypothetical protein